MPVTKFLFGDEISKELKDIVDANKMAAKVMPKFGESSRRGRGSFRGRGPFLGRGKSLSR